jgi:hypothetical protein
VRCVVLRSLIAVVPSCDKLSATWVLRLCQRAANDNDPTVRALMARAVAVFTLALPAIMRRRQAATTSAATAAAATATATATAVALPNGTTGGGDGDSSEDWDEEEEEEEEDDVDLHLLRCKLIPLVTRAAEDGDWSVREEVACDMGALCLGLGERWSMVLIDLVQSLMRDHDDLVSE